MKRNHIGYVLMNGTLQTCSEPTRTQVTLASLFKTHLLKAHSLTPVPCRFS